MLGVMRDPWSVAPSPLLENFVLVLLMPVGQRIASSVQSRFLFEFTCCSLLQGLTLILTASHRLPISRMISTLQEQYIQCRSVHHHQNGNRNLELQSTIDQPANCGPLLSSNSLRNVRRTNADMQLAQLFLVNLARRLGQQALPALSFRECDHVAD